MAETGTWKPFDVHDSNRTPRARLQVNTGGNSASVLFDSITLDIAPGGLWKASADDLGRTWTGESDSATGAIIALLADRLGLDARITMRDEW